MRREVLELLRDKTNLVIRGINAKTHASDKDIAWTMLHILLSSDDLDENERGMFEGYAKYLLKNKRLTTKQLEWLNKRTAPGFDVGAHRSKMARLNEARCFGNPRGDSKELCLRCGKWRPFEPVEYCEHEEVAILSTNEMDTSILAGLAAAIVKHDHCKELAQGALRRFADTFAAEGTVQIVQR